MVIRSTVLSIQLDVSLIVSYAICALDLLEADQAVVFQITNKCQYRTISQIPQRTCPISRNTPHWNRNVHISFVPKWCIVCYGTACGICEIVLLLISPDSKVHVADMNLSAPDGPHVGPMNLAIRDSKVHVADMGPPGSCRPQMGPMLAHEPCYLSSPYINTSPR